MLAGMQDIAAYGETTQLGELRQASLVLPEV